MSMARWKATRGVRALALAVCAGAFLAGCGDSGAEDPEAALRKRGRVVYDTNCTACHAIDPAKPGPVGPAIAGSSLALLEAKVLRNEYPPGYEPQRETQAMIPLPHLEKDLPAIHAYLTSEAP